MSNVRGAARKSAETAMPDLDDWLQRNRDAGLSYKQIIRQLFVENGYTVHVSYRTIKRWVDALEVAAAKEKG